MCVLWRSVDMSARSVDSSSSLEEEKREQESRNQDLMHIDEDKDPAVEVSALTNIVCAMDDGW